MTPQTFPSTSPPFVPRAVRRLVAAALTALLAAAGAHAADKPVPELKGSYYGVGAAQGMHVEIRRVGRKPAGTFRDSNGTEAKIGGGWKDGGLEAVLVFPKRAVFTRLTPQSLGLEMLVLPFDAEGAPQPGQARTLAFLRDGVKMPPLPGGVYQDPPARAGGVVDPDVFLASYQFWPPNGAARGFSAIGGRYRTMIRLFPQVNADVLWKLCQATSPERSLAAEALRGQAATCRDVVSTIEGTQEKGRFAEWKTAVKRDIDGLMVAVQCARGFIVKKSVCGPASRRVAAAATSMETVGDVLRRYR